MSTIDKSPRLVPVETMIRWYEMVEAAYQAIEEKPARAKHMLSELEDQIDAIINPK